MSPQDLLNRLHDQPFRPFRVKLSNITSIDITDPGLVMVEFADLEPPREKRKRSA